MLKISTALLLLLTAAPSLDAMCTPRNRQVADQDDDENQTTQVDVDVWYGPGFYYGIWFDNEAAYWAWRGNHRGYPSNRGYYHPSHPVYYSHGGSGGGGHGGGGHGGGHGGGGHH